MKKRKKIFYKAIAGAAALSLVTGLTAMAAENENPESKSDQTDISEEQTAAAEIPEDQSDLEDAEEITISNGEISGIDLDKSGDDITFDGETLCINKAGTYVLSGELEGTIKVSASKNKEVVLVLNGIKVTNETDSALLVKKAAGLKLVLMEGTENSFTGGQPVEINENSAETAAENKGAAVEIKPDTVITGTGKLIVNGYINNGLSVSGSLSVESGSIAVNAVNNGIKVKNDLTVNSGNIETLTGGDALKAEKEAVEAADAVIDETSGEIVTEAVEAEDAAGSITVNGGSINIDSYGDALSAMLDLTVNGGNITVKTEGEYNNGESRGDSPGNSAGADTVSEKGLKSQGTININGGTITVDSKDDAVHCTDNLLIAGGELTLSTGDDGLHSDVRIDINDGSVEILDSYEGIEANQIYVTGGSVSLKSSDDGFNANGGSQSFGGPGGSNGQAADQTNTETPNLYITGGSVYVNADGDGLDSNANIYITGGETLVEGPEDSANGPLDSGSENGGELKVSGGTIAASGASGMAETFDSTSEQNSIKLVLNSSFKAGTDIAVKDMAGNVIFSYTAAKSGNSIVFSSPEVKTDETITITIGDVDYQIPITSVSTTVTGAADGTVTAGSNGGQGGQGGPGGQGGQRQPGNNNQGQNNGAKPSATAGGNQATEPRTQEAAEDA